MNDAQKADDKFKLYTEDPSEVIYAIVSDAHMHDLEIISIMTLYSSFEEVFVKLTGLQKTGNGIYAIY